METRADALPLVTVIMPVRNEAGFIERSLGAVLAQDYPIDHIEVVLADGRSQDGTKEVIKRMLRRRWAEAATACRARLSRKPLANLYPSLVILDNPSEIAPAGLNAAIRRARGDIVIRVDGHTLLGPDYVRRCVESLMEHDVECVGGAVDSVGVGYIGRATALAMSSPFGVGGSRFRVADSNSTPSLTDTVPFPAFRQSVFSSVGLFNEAMVRHQDYEFNYRVRKAGGRILLLPSVRAKYYVRSTLKQLLAQYWQYGVWKGRFLGAHPDSLKLRHLIPASFTFTISAGAVGCLLLSSLLWPTAAALAAYLVFLLVASVLCAKGGLKYAPILPAVLACMHLSYGAGVWMGLLSFVSDQARTKAQAAT